MTPKNRFKASRGKSFGQNGRRSPRFVIRKAPKASFAFNDQRDLDRLLTVFDRLEREIAAAEAALHDPDLYSKHPDKFATLTKSLDTLRPEKDAAEERWLDVRGWPSSLPGGERCVGHRKR